LEDGTGVGVSSSLESGPSSFRSTTSSNSLLAPSLVEGAESGIAGNRSSTSASISAFPSDLSPSDSTTPAIDFLTGLNFSLSFVSPGGAEEGARKEVRLLATEFSKDGFGGSVGDFGRRLGCGEAGRGTVPGANESRPESPSSPSRSNAGGFEVDGSEGDDRSNSGILDCRNPERPFAGAAGGCTPLDDVFEAVDPFFQLARR